MKISIAALTAILAASVSAAPAADAAPQTVSMAAQTSWIFQRVKRVCPSTTTCNWSFGINASSVVTPCKFTVNANPATEANFTGIACGPYTVNGGWSGQFGPGNGFTTLAVVNNAKKQIAYPAYTDSELASGKPVTPNRSYPVQNLPSS